MQVSTEYGRLEVQTFGPEDGAPVVFISGLGEQLIHWPREFMSALGSYGFRSILFDNRDVGLSARCPVDGSPDTADAILAEIAAGRPLMAAYNLSDMAGDVVDIMDALNLRDAHVFGTALGGGVVQVLAAQHPQRVRSATMAMTASELPGPETLTKLVAYPLDRDDFVRASMEADHSWGSPGYPMSATQVQDVAQRAYDRGHDPAGVNRQLVAAMAIHNPVQPASGVTCPSLVIHGLEDPLIPPSAAFQLAQLIPGSELQLVSGMGHVITPALAPRVARMFAQFVNRAVQRQAA